MEKYWAASCRPISFLNNSNIVNCTSHNSAVQPLTVSEKKVDVNDFNNHRVFKAKLPSINLPSFEGSYDSWLGFHDLFKSLVHEDTELSNIEKLYHLKGCLKGEATDIVESLEISSDNCIVA